MSLTDRILVAFGVLAVVVLAAGAAGATWLYHAYGTVEVEVRSTGTGGDDVSIRLPGALVRVAAEFIPEEARRESAREIAAWMPVARAALTELSRCPDARLVDVKSPEESVRISKRGNVLLAEVDSRNESVRVSIPLAAAQAVLDHLQGPADALLEARTE